MVAAHHKIPAEDLILFTLPAGRPRELLDVEAIVFVQGRMDEASMRRRAGPLDVADGLENALATRA